MGRVYEYHRKKLMCTCATAKVSRVHAECVSARVRATVVEASKSDDKTTSATIRWFLNEEYFNRRTHLEAQRSKSEDHRFSHSNTV